MARIIKNKSKNSRKFSSATSVSVSSATSVGINSPITNTLVTVGSNTASLDSERVLTFDGNKLSVQAGMVYKRREMTSATTLTASDYYIACKITSSSTLTLPSASTLAAGQTFVIKDEGGALNDSVILTVAAPSGQTIEGESTLSMKLGTMSVFIYTDGATKYFIY